MSVTIKPTEHDAFLVNDKPIYKDSNGNWIAPIELTSIESMAFHKHTNCKKHIPLDEEEQEF